MATIKYYSNEVLVQSLQDKHKELDRNPKSSECNGSNNMPSTLAFQSHFGSYSNALEAAGLRKNPEDKFKEELREVCKDGFVPTTSWCIQNGHQKLVDYVYNRGMKWAQALDYYGVRKFENVVKRMDDIAEGLRKLKKELDRIPRIEDLSRNPDLPESDIIRNLFGSWREALDYAGLVHFYATKEEAITALKELCKESGAPRFKELETLNYGLALAIKRNFSGYKAALEEAGVKRAHLKRNKNARFKTQQEVADAIIAMAKNCYLPTTDEIHSADATLYSAMYRLFSGGYKDVVALIRKTRRDLSIKPKKKPVRLLSQEQNAFLDQMRILRNELGYIPQQKKWLIENGRGDMLNLAEQAYGSWRAGRLAFAKYLKYSKEESP